MITTSLPLSASLAYAVPFGRDEIKSLMLVYFVTSETEVLSGIGAASFTSIGRTTVTTDSAVAASPHPAIASIPASKMPVINCVDLLFIFILLS